MNDESQLIEQALQGDRAALFEALKHESRTAVGFEVPNRMQSTLEELLAVLGGERKVVLAREITKLHEEFMRGTLEEIVTSIQDQGTRGEYTLVLGGAEASEQWTEDEVRSALARELEQGSSRTMAAKSIADLSGWSRRQIYSISLEDE